jgi:AcrR family transcriptional regulator
MVKRKPTEDFSSKTYDRKKKIQIIKEITRKSIEMWGYDATTNHGIAAEAGLSVGLLYKYFPRGKIDILHALLEDEQIAFQESKRDILRATFTETLMNTNYLPFITQLLTRVFHQHVVDQKYVQALEIAMLSHPDIFKDVRGTAQELLSITDLMESLWKLGVLEQHWTDGEVQMRMLMLDQLMHQYIFFRNPPIPSEKEFLERLLELTCQLFRIKP